MRRRSALVSAGRPWPRRSSPRTVPAAGGLDAGGVFLFQAPLAKTRRAAPGERLRQQWREDRPMDLRIKRIYAAPAPEDGRRILVDRLWPRGLRKEEARLDAWLKEIAPSDALRAWYGHDPGKWPAFQERYFAELDASPEAVARLRDMVAAGPATLVYSSREEERNNAAALKIYLAQRIGEANAAPLQKQRGAGTSAPAPADPADAAFSPVSSPAGPPRSSCGRPGRREGSLRPSPCPGRRRRP